VVVMIPFCRTPDEGRRVLRIMSEAGLVRGELDLRVHLMCEIPSNVLLADTFCELFDGLSIGSDDLTQLTLGIDKESENLKDLFDERSPALKQMVESTTWRVHKDDS
jgi:pyruvate,water dikinase